MSVESIIKISLNIELCNHTSFCGAYPEPISTKCGECDRPGHHCVATLNTLPGDKPYVDPGRMTRREAVVDLP